MNTLTRTFAPLTRLRASFDRLAGPQSTLCSVILLIARAYLFYVFFRSGLTLSLIHISEPTRRVLISRMPSSA